MKFIDKQNRTNAKYFMKIHHYLSFTILPVFLAILYVAGLNYYHNWFLVFGIPYGIFHTDLYDTLYLGGQIFFFLTSKIFIPFYGIMILYLVIGLAFSYVPLYNWSISKLNYFFKNQLSNKKFNTSNKPTSTFISEFILVFYGIHCVIILFSYVIFISSHHGEEAGNESKKLYLESFLLIDQKIKPKDKNILTFKINNNPKLKIGYILATNENLVAMYVKDEGLTITKLSNIEEIKNYN